MLIPKRKSQEIVELVTKKDLKPSNGNNLII